MESENAHWSVFQFVLPLLPRLLCRNNVGSAFFVSNPFRPSVFNPYSSVIFRKNPSRYVNH
eukprot:6641506-Lingulodinium_polyedra.AAC.1